MPTHDNVNPLDGKLDNTKPIAEQPSAESSKPRSRTLFSISRSASINTVKQIRAKAEAAKAKIAFAEQQAFIKKQQAQTQAKANKQKADAEAKADIRQADFDLLATKGEAAAAEAEARALEEDEDGSQNLDDMLPPKTGPDDLVQHYLDQQRKMAFVPQTTEGDSPAGNIPDTTAFTVSAQLPTTSFANPLDISALPVPTRVLQRPTTYPYDYYNISSPNYGGQPTMFAPSRQQHKLTGPPIVSSRLNQHAPTFVPSAHPVAPTYQPEATGHAQLVQQTSDITKFLLRKDLLFSRLTTFNDKPESYQLWKSRFKCVAEELNLSDSEQLDLLAKWLGTSSSPQATSIMASNADNPSAGIKRVWKRLEMRYGAPEMVEASIKKKLEDFPKLTNKDNQRLFELYDILSEIEFLKENPTYKNLLSYFDSSAGVRPIVSKLPHGLQEKWVTRGGSYKAKHNVFFPPFKEFVEFIRDMSKLRNDPGFQFDSEISTNTRDSTQLSKNRANVHKSNFDQQMYDDDTLDKCVIHMINLPLTECRAFRSKSINERRELLKQHNICYKCCDSTSHTSRECTANVSCSECGSNRHHTAMHITRNNGARTESSSTSASQNNGGEAKNADSNTRNVNSTCTAVLGIENSGRSYAKIIAVSVYHKNKPNKRIKIYAVIDDQRNRSLATPEFFRLFNIKKKPKHYTISTCSGKIVTSGRRASDFVVGSLNGDSRLNLPVITECDHIPDNRDEIPTPEVATNHPHLKDLIGKIPVIDANSQILLILGRDVIEAHHVLDQQLGPSSTPFAQRQRLGWVIVGETRPDVKPTHTDVHVKGTHVLLSERSSPLKPSLDNVTRRDHRSEVPATTPSKLQLAAEPDFGVPKRLDGTTKEPEVENNLASGRFSPERRPLISPRNTSNTSNKQKLRTVTLKVPEARQRPLRYVPNLRTALAGKTKVYKKTDRIGSFSSPDLLDNFPPDRKSTMDFWTHPPRASQLHDSYWPFKPKHPSQMDTDIIEEDHPFTDPKGNKRFHRKGSSGRKSH